MTNLFELLGVIGQFFLLFSKDVNEEEIEKNIQYLKRFDWFESYLKDDDFNHLINHNTNVRYVIGTCNLTKVKKSRYINIYRKRIHKELLAEA
ncbi:hypothetical protein FZW96_14345 [Bacillus sp. BGMRC 2118]|nr:hypothetical protein FZW96_14345 [Bacillus sp. BGMRC 2118]